MRSAQACLTGMLIVFAPAAAYLAARDRRAARRPLALATIVWLAVSIPWIALLSSEKDRLTIGDTARDTYVWEVGDLPYRHWQGEEPGFGEPVHPTRLIHPDPPVYEFGEPVAGTYPIWYDPSYWYEGVRMRFSLSRQVLTVLRSLLVYLPVVDAFLLSWLVLFIAGVRRRSDLRRPFTAYGFLLFPAMFALLLYAMVHVQQRYIAGFWTLAILALMLGLRLPRSDMTPRVFRGAVLATVFVLGARLCMLAVADVRLALDPPVDWQRSGAAGLRRMGVLMGADLEPAVGGGEVAPRADHRRDTTRERRAVLERGRGDQGWDPRAVRGRGGRCGLRVRRAPPGADGGLDGPRPDPFRPTPAGSRLSQNPSQ